MLRRGPASPLRGATAVSRTASRGCGEREAAEVRREAGGRAAMG
jgi:hypothetical protein